MMLSLWLRRSFRLFSQYNGSGGGRRSARRSGEYQIHRHRFTPRLETLEVRALLNAGTPDPTFAVGAQGISSPPYGVVMTPVQEVGGVESVAIQPDGKILVAGHYGAIIRYNSDGTLDSTFGTNGIVPGGAVEETITEIAVAANGAIIASGTTNLGAAVFEFNSTGTPNASFGTDGIVTLDSAPNSATEGIVLQPDGKIVGVVMVIKGIPGGPFYSYMVTDVFRLNADGTPDSTFVSPNIPVTFGGPLSLALAPNGQIVFDAVDAGPPNITTTNITLYRLNPDGSQDKAFVGGNGDLQVPNAFGLAIDANNRIVIAIAVGGYSSPRFEIERFNVNGTPDATFGGQGGAGIGQVFTTIPPASVLVQPDGRIVVVGTIYGKLFSHVPNALALTRYNPNGTLDTTFGDNGTSTITGTATSTLDPTGTFIDTAGPAVLQPDGKIVAVGLAATASVGFDFLTARFLGDTPSGTAHQRFVSQVYLDLLQRPADPGGLAFWSGLLDSGQETAQQVALGIEQSQEHHHLVVNELYGEYLHRAADPVGLAGWSAFLGGGGTIDELRAHLLGSAEYFADSGNTNGGFVTAVYRDVLGRPVDLGGGRAWQGALAAGASPLAVAVTIINSPEAISDEVTGLYFRLLHRAPDPIGLQVFSQALEQGVPTELMLSAIIGSPEYFTVAGLG